MPRALLHRVHRGRDPFLFVGAFLAIAGASGGCAPADGDDAGSSSASAFTVSNGDRFVVSATPERIVLARHVGAAEFPFDASSLIGKAILIHPVQSRADFGVYARALAVTVENDSYVVTSEPLTLAEMESITEAEIVRIFVDSQRSLRPTSLIAAGLSPQGLTWGSPAGLGAAVSVGLAPSAFVAPTMYVSHDIQSASLQPDVAIDWTRAQGLELGFRGALDWRSSLHFKGTVTAGVEVYSSKELTSRPWLTAIPIGPVPVPVVLTTSASVTCSANASGSLEGTLKIAIDASLGGSVLIKPESSSPPTTWFHEGRWPATATAHASATLTDKKTSGAVSLSCGVPRVVLHAKLGGLGGPYLALVPTVTVGPAGALVRASVVAGVEGKVMGLAGSAETTIATYTP